MAGTGYDASASNSDSTTQGLNLGAGDWSVGGGVKLPPWLLAVAVVVAGVVLVKFFTRK